MASSFVAVDLRIPNNAPLTYGQVDSNFTVLQRQMPIGAYLDYPVNDDIPETFLECDGASLAKSAYAELFGVIGTTFGDDGDNFKLPDTRGYFMRHLGGVDPDTRTIGDTQEHAYGTHSHDSYNSESGGSLSGNTRLFLTAQGYAGDTAFGYTRESGGLETRPVNMSYIRLIKAYSVTPV